MTKLEFQAFEIDAAVVRAEELLRAGKTVMFILKFKGRDMVRTRLGFESMKRALSVLSPFGKVQAEPKLVGRRLCVTIMPRQTSEDT